jgi:hypothetical protein
MNEGLSSPAKEVIYRRLTEPIELFGTESPVWWVLLVLAVLGLGHFYIDWLYTKDSQTRGTLSNWMLRKFRVWTYLALALAAFYFGGPRDLAPEHDQLVQWLTPAVGLLYLVLGFFLFLGSRGVGVWWALTLSTMRAAVYVLIAWVFLLRGEQSVEKTIVQSRAAVVFDVSGSTWTIDDIPSDDNIDKLDTRQAKVLKFLDQKKFLAKLEENNPIWVYRFGRHLDDEYLLFRDGKAWTRTEWEDPNRPLTPIVAGATAKPLPEELWRAFLNMPLPAGRDKAVAGLSEQDGKRLSALLEHNAKLDQIGFTQGTNVGDSVLAALNLHSGNRMQGVIVFTDGHSTEGSVEKLGEIQQTAKAANIPIFVVGVGEERPQVKLRIADVRTPDQVQPEDPFRVVVDVTGEGLPKEEVDLTLEVRHVRRNADGKEEELDVALAEANSSSDDKKPGTKKPDDKEPPEKRPLLPLGKRLELRPTGPVVLLPGERDPLPRATVELPIDAKTLAAAARIDLSAPEYAGKKYELAETNDGELRFIARVPRHKLEIFRDKVHVNDPPAAVRVIKKPLKVLLFASAPTRDYQFLRTLLVREMEKKRGEVSIYIQPAPGHVDQRPGVVQDVEPERLLKEFPHRLKAASTAKEDVLNSLDEYDVIVAFDPDWTKLDDNQIKDIMAWVNKGGGLICIGGPINTLQLARPGSAKDKLAPILELYPVVLRDVRIDDLDRTTQDPWALNFNSVAANPPEFLKLEEGEGEGVKKFPEDWNAFFYGPPEGGAAAGTRQALRGFFNYYPVERAKGGSVIIGKFTDPKAKIKLEDGKEDQQPFLVLSNPAAGRRVVWIGSGETWRLRQYREAYHERFWTKLLRYAGENSRSRTHRSIRLEMAPAYVQHKSVDVRAKIEGPDGLPLPNTATPEISVKVLGVRDQPSAFSSAIRMRPRSTAKEKGDPVEDNLAGWFAAQFQVPLAGTYQLSLKVPETGESQDRTFVVREANPEMDDTRPDFERMYQLATEADVVLDRLAATEKQALRDQLRSAVPAGLSSKELGAKPRLYFNLKTAQIIPSCLRKDPKEETHRGKIVDRWADGLLLHPRVRYVLHQDDFEALQKNGVPKPVTEKLENLKDRGFATKEEFLDEGLGTVLDREEVVRYQGPVIDAAKVPNLPDEKKSVILPYVLLAAVGLLGIEWLIRKLLRLA